MDEGAGTAALDMIGGRSNDRPYKYTKTSIIYQVWATERGLDAPIQTGLLSTTVSVSYKMYRSGPTCKERWSTKYQYI